MEYLTIFIASFAEGLGKELGVQLARRILGGSSGGSGVTMDQIAAAMRSLLEEYTKRLRAELQIVRLQDAVAALRAAQEVVIRYADEGETARGLLEDMTILTSVAETRLRELGLPGLSHYAIGVCLSITVYEERSKVFASDKPLGTAANFVASAVRLVDASKEQVVAMSDARFSRLWTAGERSAPGELPRYRHSYSHQRDDGVWETISFLDEGGVGYGDAENSRRQHIEAERARLLTGINPAIAAAIEWRRWLKVLKEGKGIEPDEPLDYREFATVMQNQSRQIASQ